MRNRFQEDQGVQVMAKRYTDEYDEDEVRPRKKSSGKGGSSSGKKRSGKKKAGKKALAK